MKNKFLYFVMVLFLLFSSIFSQSQHIVINEFLASNSSINIDSDFNSHSDWIELYNPTNNSVDLSN